MQQVPTYLIIGDGRLAKHLSFYFDSLKVHHSRWTRKSQQDLQSISKNYSHILLAITDGVIESFINENKFLKTKVLVHFSGAMEIEDIVCFHPLMTFTNDLYESEFYKTIPFISFNNDIGFKDFFPMLPNPTTKIEKVHIPYYHALCVTSGNFTTLLWAKCIEAFNEIGIDKNLLEPYMEKVFENTLIDPLKNLTGPIVRNDSETIKKNIDSLAEPQLKRLYQSFVEISKGMELL